jgi:hypothetical protein
MIGPDTDAWHRITKHVPRGEKLLWAGRPGSGVRFRVTDFFLIPFGLLWCVFGTGFGLAAFYAADTLYAVLFCTFFSISSWIVGFFSTVGRYFYDAWERTRALYGLTDRKVLVVSADRLDDDGWASLGAITHLTLKVRRNGEGIIRIHTKTMLRRGEHDYYLTVSFEFIPDAARVYGLIQDAKAKYRPKGLF